MKRRYTHIVHFSATLHRQSVSIRWSWHTIEYVYDRRIFTTLNLRIAIAISLVASTTRIVVIKKLHLVASRCVIFTTWHLLLSVATNSRHFSPKQFRIITFSDKADNIRITSLISIIANTTATMNAMTILLIPCASYSSRAISKCLSIFAKFCVFYLCKE